MIGRVFIIHNPTAGERKNFSFSKQIQSTFPETLDFKYQETKYPKHGLELAKQALAEHYDIVVVAGGDGTVNEVASQLIHTNLKLCIIPLGSGNGLARHLRVPLDPIQALKLVFEGKVRTIDVGVANGNKFFCAAGVGFDAEVSALFERSKTRGLKTYLWLGAKKYLTYRNKKYELTIDNTQISTKAFLISIANAAQFGNNAFISPGSKIDDGILDVVIIKPFNILQGILLFRRLFNKKITRCKPYSSVSGKEIRFELQEEVNYHCDGEVFKATGELKMEVIQRALHVLVPVEQK